MRLPATSVAEVSGARHDLEKNCCPAEIPLDFTAKASIAVGVDGLLLDRRLAWPKEPGLWWCKHRDRRGANVENEALSVRVSDAGPARSRPGRPGWRVGELLCDIASLRLKGAALSKPVGAGAEIT